MTPSPRLFKCVRCPALMLIAFYTQTAGGYLCGNCADHLPGDPPQTYALRYDRTSGKVYRKAPDGQWFDVASRFETPGEET